jgi:hypothetical protein
MKKSKRIRNRLRTERISYRAIEDFQTSLLTSIRVLSEVATVYIIFDSTVTDVLQGINDHLKNLVKKTELQIFFVEQQPVSI